MAIVSIAPSQTQHLRVALGVSWHADCSNGVFHSDVRWGQVEDTHHLDARDHVFWSDVCFVHIYIGWYIYIIIYTHIICIYIYIIPDSCKFADMMICLLVWCYHSAYQIVSFMYAKYGRMYESTCAYTYTYTYTYRISIYILHSSHIDMTYCTYNIHIKYIHIKYIYIYTLYNYIYIYTHMHTHYKLQRVSENILKQPPHVSPLPPWTFGTRGYAAMESNCSVLVSDNSSGFITGQLSWHHIFEEAEGLFGEGR